MRGVHLPDFIAHLFNQGSSPHARGPLQPQQPAPGHYRIIPACAGSTNAVRVSPKRAQDHPRMCGVHSLYSSARSKRQGSSPHARGPQISCIFSPFLYRIIPACAGSTAFCKRSCMVIEDHPRMRGVHSPARWQPLKATGSSPHARGPRWAVGL